MQSGDKNGYHEGDQVEKISESLMNHENFQGVTILRLMTEHNSYVKER